MMPFTEMGNTERRFKVQVTNMLCMLSVRFIILIKVEILGGGEEMNKGKMRRGS